MARSPPLSGRQFWLGPFMGQRRLSIQGFGGDAANAASDERMSTSEVAASARNPKPLNPKP